jgi:NAD(P)H-nitrite reductase large subunit
MNMAGRNVAYRGSLSMNVLDTAGLISHTFGIWQGVDDGEVVETADEDRNLYTRLCFKDDRMVGAITIGRPNHVGAIRGLIQQRRALGEWKEKLSKNPSLVMEAFVALRH